MRQFAGTNEFTSIDFLPAGSNESITSRVVCAMKHDFVKKNLDEGAGDRNCLLGQSCSLFTEGQNVRESERFVYGRMQDAEEALRHLLRLWISAGSSGFLPGRPGFAMLGVSLDAMLYTSVGTYVMAVQWSQGVGLSILVGPLRLLRIYTPHC